MRKIMSFDERSPRSRRLSAYSPIGRDLATIHEAPPSQQQLIAQLRDLEQRLKEQRRETEVSWAHECVGLA